MLLGEGIMGVARRGVWSGEGLIGMVRDMFWNSVNSGNT